MALKAVYLYAAVGKLLLCSSASFIHSPERCVRQRRAPSPWRRGALAPRPGAGVRLLLHAGPPPSYSCTPPSPSLLLRLIPSLILLIFISSSLPWIASDIDLERQLDLWSGQILWVQLILASWDHLVFIIRIWLIFFVVCKNCAP